MTRGGPAEYLIETIKKIAYRAPLVNELSRPNYRYNLEPAQLAWLCHALDATAGAGEGAVVEVGVARGLTTVFLLEHMRRSGDRRPYYCIDTFTGFVPEEIAFEVSRRGKRPTHYRSFAYNDVRVFTRNIRRFGFDNVRVVKCDAGSFDWSAIPLIDLMLLDVDLYLPTKAVLERSSPRWSKAARIMVDDVTSGGDYDGAYAAFHEFCAAHGLPSTRVGNKGGVLVEPRLRKDGE